MTENQLAKYLIGAKADILISMRENIMEGDNEIVTWHKKLDFSKGRKIRRILNYLFEKGLIEEPSINANLTDKGLRISAMTYC